MHPELTAYRNSPHSRVRCVDCHIGPGASWFVKSKLSGTRQVFAAILKTYPRPVPTPVHNLRPARETCEQCHWPQKFHGNKLMVKTHYQDDEANTAVKSVLALRIGGGADLPAGEASIHWHINNKVEYLSDESREQMYWVRAERPDGTVKEFFRPGMAQADPPTFESLPDSLKAHSKRSMDCVDCHNRPTHIYKPAQVALDEAMSLGRIPLDLPFLHREAMSVLQETYPDKETALARIRGKLESFYTSEYPDLARDRATDVALAVAGVAKIYADNVFPSMNITWDTYPNHLGHQNFPGCFRCHDEEMATAGGETISQDCATCHSLLAMEEENPEILQDLFPED
jgi:nitrate/TMAO reductase-like tetraheme cytochrome c subunit